MVQGSLFIKGYREIKHKDLGFQYFVKNPIISNNQQVLYIFVIEVGTFKENLSQEIC